MKFFVKAIFLIYILGLATFAVSAVNIKINCLKVLDINIAWIGKTYTCVVENSINSLVKDTSITSVVGPSGNIADIGLIRGLQIDGSRVKFFPKRINSMFSQLKALSIISSGLKEVKTENLKDFGDTLEYLDLSKNDINEIEKDLLKYNTNIKVISFDENPIKYIDPDFFGSLKSLSFITIVSFNDAGCLSQRFFKKEGNKISNFYWFAEKCSEISGMLETQCVKATDECLGKIFSSASQSFELIKKFDKSKPECEKENVNANFTERDENLKTSLDIIDRKVDKIIKDQIEVSSWNKQCKQSIEDTKLIVREDFGKVRGQFESIHASVKKNQDVFIEHCSCTKNESSENMEIVEFVQQNMINLNASLADYNARLGQELNNNIRLFFHDAIKNPNITTPSSQNYFDQKLNEVSHIMTEKYESSEKKLCDLVERNMREMETRINNQLYELSISISDRPEQEILKNKIRYLEETAYQLLQSLQGLARIIGETGEPTTTNSTTLHHPSKAGNPRRIATTEKTTKTTDSSPYSPNDDRTEADNPPIATPGKDTNTTDSSPYSPKDERTKAETKTTLRPRTISKERTTSRPITDKPKTYTTRQPNTSSSTETTPIITTQETTITSTTKLPCEDSLAIMREQMAIMQQQLDNLINKKR